MKGNGKERVFNYIKSYIKEKGFAPSVRDMTHDLGFHSTSSVHRYLVELEDSGYIERIKPRIYKVLKENFEG